MKILHVIPAYEPAWAFGGTVTATSNLCRALVKQGVDITVYTTNADGKGGLLDVPIGTEMNLGGVKVYYYPSSFGSGNTFYSKQLSKKLEDTVKDYDIVHVAAVWQWMQVDVSRICTKLKTPYVISQHGSLNPWSWTQKTWKKSLYWSLFAKKTFTNSSAIHYTCQEERLLTHTLLAKSQHISGFVIPNGIYMPERSRIQNIRRKLCIPPDKSILLYAGRIHRKKGLDLIISAMSCPGLENLVFVLVGHAEDMEYVHHLNMIASKIKDRVIWCSPVSAEEIWDYYLSATLFVLPSQDENFGMVVVEAMSCGLPVLISRNVGIWRDIEKDDAGFIVNRNVAEIAASLKKVSQDTALLKQMSENAMKSAKSRYHIDNVAVLMLQAYKDILLGTRTKELQWE